MRTVAPRGPDQRGVLLSSPVALLSAAAIVLAGAAFVVTDGSRDAGATAASAGARPAGSPSGSARARASAAPTATAVRPVIRHRKPPKPVVRRGETYVEVYNNSGISGLAGSTAARAQGAGWQVVGSDNWYGTIPASTVYYPPRLHAAARLLGRDLGISRLRPAIAPMRGDRLTVILTGDYS
jgi:hypothetical protein